MLEQIAVIHYEWPLSFQRSGLCYRSLVQAHFSTIGWVICVHMFMQLVLWRVGGGAQYHCQLNSCTGKCCVQWQLPVVLLFLPCIYNLSGSQFGDSLPQRQLAHNWGWYKAKSIIIIGYLGCCSFRLLSTWVKTFAKKILPNGYRLISCSNNDGFVRDEKLSNHCKKC